MGECCSCGRGAGSCSSLRILVSRSWTAVAMRASTSLSWSSLRLSATLNSSSQISRSFLFAIFAGYLKGLLQKVCFLNDLLPNSALMLVYEIAISA